jgi:hypothetical protein
VFRFLRTFFAGLGLAKGGTGLGYTKRRREPPRAPAHSRALMAVRDKLTREINTIDWMTFDTAYENPQTVPVDLKLLLFGDEDQAIHAIDRLSASLCHQHAYLSSAAEPALPFLIEAVQRSDERMKVHILDILLGFVSCHDPELPFTNRILEGISAERPILEILRNSEREDLAEFAEMVCEALAEQGA